MSRRHPIARVTHVPPMPLDTVNVCVKGKCPAWGLHMETLGRLELRRRGADVRAGEHAGCPSVSQASDAGSPGQGPGGGNQCRLVPRWQFCSLCTEGGWGAAMAVRGGTCLWCSSCSGSCFWQTAGEPQLPTRTRVGAEVEGALVQFSVPAPLLSWPLPGQMRT